MKNLKLYILAAMALLAVGCNDFLDKDPRDTLLDNDTFWNNANDLTSYCNKFYDNYVGYSYGGGAGWFYFKSLSDDQARADFDNWTYVTVMSTSSDWNNNFTEVRRADYVLQKLQNSTLGDSYKAEFNAIARLNRAWAYYQLVREFGDVQWISEPIIDPEADNVHGERTDRDVVMDSVLVDLDYAIANLSSSSDKTSWSKEMALAMKSDVCLYEGTFCKYRTESENGKAPDLTRAEKYLNESVAASEALMSSGNYSLTDEYGEIYNSLDLSNVNEIIFFRNYEKDIVMHGLCDYTCGSTEQRGITKDAVNSFLFLDGKPLALTSLSVEDAAEEVITMTQDSDGEAVYDTIYSITNMLAQRDKRLSVLIDTVLAFKGHGWARPNDYDYSVQMTSSTGYTIRKYDNIHLETYYRTNTNTNYTDAPLYWYAVILLNEAEAKAELGTITQTDLDNTINLLMARAGLPDMTLEPEADPANNMGVSNLIWEIRRCRRCELMLDNWYRYWDMIRWHQLDKLDSSTYPDINRGANLENVENPSMDLDADNYIIATTKTREFDPKYYLYPVPSSEISLNGNIEQNPGW